MSRLTCGLVVAAGVGLLAGCGGNKGGAEGTPEPGKDALEDLGRFLKSWAEDHHKPPAKMADLKPIEPLLTVAYHALQTGEIVYVWGTSYSPSGSRVIAYEKKTPTEGGYALLEDGTVKMMSAGEFASAPKPK